MEKRDQQKIAPKNAVETFKHLPFPNTAISGRNVDGQWSWLCSQGLAYQGTDVLSGLQLDILGAVGIVEGSEYD